MHSARKRTPLHKTPAICSKTLRGKKLKDQLLEHSAANRTVLATQNASDSKPYSHPIRNEALRFLDQPYHTKLLATH